MPTPTRLDYAVFVSDPIPQLTPTPLPSGEQAVTPPLASTLIFGERDAVLVDAPTTLAQAVPLADWVVASGKRLTHIFVTHGHGDHWFGVSTLVARFPDVKVVATAGTIAMMSVQGSTEFRAQLWDVVFPGQIGETTVLAQTSDHGVIELEGNTLRIVEVGHTDTDDTSVLHVPSLDLVVAGDAAYNGVHQYLAESGHGGRQAWLGAVDVIEQLAPRWVVAGHKDPALDDDVTRVLRQTRDYLKVAGRVLDEQATPAGYFHEMTTRYPTLLNRGVVWLNAGALYQ